MPDAEPTRPQVIGLTGSFGSGCTYLAENVLSAQGYQKVSLSALLRRAYEQDRGVPSAGVARRALQDFGDEQRSKHGSGFFAEKALEEIQGAVREGVSKFAVDSIRNPAEIRVLREHTSRFFLLGVYAEKATRWERVKDKYDDNEKAFDEDDKNDNGNDNPSHGQRVGDCFYEADIIIKNMDKVAVVNNEEFQRLRDRVVQYIDLAERPLERKQPRRQEEALMAMAYAASMQSSCLKRKVGAIIVDEGGNIISSGFNEVPGHESPCGKEFTKCHRDWLCDDFFGKKLGKQIPAIAGKEEELRKLFRKEFRILDVCRALHAEENAILNLARNAPSVPLERCTIYVTTYPCRQCASRIVRAGMKRVVYVEPYPDPESEFIFHHAAVSAEIFEGITFRAYFRIYGEQR